MVRPTSAVAVSALTNIARDILEGAFRPIWVRGEVTNFKAHRNGHWYFTLRDRMAQIRGVVWSKDTRSIPAPPDEGMLISAFGSLSVYPQKGEDEEGIRTFFKEFSFPGGIGSHCTPETPGSIHEGGELRYSISHAFGAAFDNPDLLVAVMVGDGEAETGALATSWHSNKFLNPIRDGAVLPILHLNGYKINNPALLARISHDELASLLHGYGWTPHFVEGDDPAVMHQQMAATLEDCVLEIRRIQQEARVSGTPTRPRWPMIVLRSPKGWTGPKDVDGHKVEGFWRAHQVPLAGMHTNPAHMQQLEDWLRSYKPEELFDASGRLRPELKALAPQGTRRMSANPHANGGVLRRPLRLPDFRDYAISVDKPGQAAADNTRPLGRFLRDILRQNMQNFRVFSPDEMTLYVDDKEVASFRAYLKKGGMVIFDDFREAEPGLDGVGHWDNLQAQMRRVLPEGRWIEIDSGTEAVWHSFFEIPNPRALAPPPIYDQSMVLRYYGIFENNDPKKRLMAIANVNGDISEYWEFSGTGFAPVDIDNEAYKYGINYFIYGILH